jgi:hypothetical protein
MRISGYGQRPAGVNVTFRARLLSAGVGRRSCPQPGPGDRGEPTRGPAAPVFAEVARVLKLTGSPWLNLGDSFSRHAPYRRLAAARELTERADRLLPIPA